MILGIDVSTYLEQQKYAHSKYYKNGQEVDPFALFKANGVNYLRTRIWNDPYDENGEPYLGGTCDLNNYLELCDVLKKYNFKQVVDFHYSDFWADPSKQILPKAWANYTFEQLLDAVYTFTKESLLKIKSKGIDVAYIQTGNEITHGMLRPLGAIDYESENPYKNFAELLKVARKACKEVYPNAKIIIHLEESFNQDLYRRIINGLHRNGLEIDVIGTSYYPFWHHNFAEYFANMDMVQREFNIPVMNVELGYPFTLEDYLPDESGKPKHLVINADSKEEFMKARGSFCPSSCSGSGSGSRSGAARGSSRPARTSSAASPPRSRRAPRSTSSACANQYSRDRTTTRRSHAPRSPVPRCS